MFAARSRASDFSTPSSKVLSAISTWCQAAWRAIQVLYPMHPAPNSRFQYRLKAVGRNSQANYRRLLLSIGLYRGWRDLSHIPSSSSIGRDSANDIICAGSFLSLGRADQ